MIRTKNIVLIGFMGTGKSTIARKLADRLGWKMIDTDQYVESHENMSIVEMFKTKGEAYFRQSETNAIRIIMQQEGQVIATGGGSVLAEENRKYMLSNSLLIALKADVKTIINRVSRDRNRPLLKGNVRQKVIRLLEQRKDAYDFAHLEINTTVSSIDEIVEQIIRHMK